eukprot:3587217-Rhodomonas_salina.1
MLTFVLRVNQFLYGPVVRKVHDEYEREWVRVKEAAAPGGKGRKVRSRGGGGGEVYKAARKDETGGVKERGTAVEVEISHLRKKGKEKGATTKAWGTIDTIVTKTEDESGKAATVHVLIPFADKEVVSLSKIRPLPAPEEQALRKELEDRMPSDIQLFVHIPEAAELSEENQQALNLNILTVGGCPYIPIEGLSGDEQQETPTWTVTRDQIATFQLLARVVDKKNRVVEHDGGGDWSWKNGAVNVKELPMRFELLDDQDKPIPRVEDGKDWTDERDNYG